MQHRSWLVAAIGAVIVGGGALLYHGLDKSAHPGPQWQVLDQYCVGCHNDDDLAGGVSFRALDRRDLGKNAKIWEAAVRKLRTGLMPPKGERRPARTVLDATAGWLESELDAVWTQIAESRDQSTRAPEPHRVRERDPRPARVRACGNRRLAAGRRLRRRLRQHRRGPRRLAHVARRLCAGGHANQPPRGGRPLDGPQRGALRGRGRRRATASHRGPAARHARWNRRRAHVSARRRVRVHRQRTPARRGLGEPDRATRVVRRPERRRRVQRRSDQRSTGVAGFGCACPRARSGSRPRSWTSGAARASTSCISAKSRSAARSRV